MKRLSLLLLLALLVVTAPANHASAGLVDKFNPFSSENDKPKSPQDTYDALFTSCLLCDPTVKIIEYATKQARTFWKSFAKTFATMAAVGGILYFGTVFFRLSVLVYPKPALIAEAIPAAIRLGIVAFLFAPPVLSAEKSYDFLRDSIFKPVIEGPMVAAAAIIATADSDSSGVTKSSRTYCKEKISSSGSSKNSSSTSASTPSYMSGAIRCTIYTMEESLSWIIVAGTSQLATFTLEGLLIGHISAIILLIAAARTMFRVPLAILTATISFALLLFAMPLALLLWIFPPTKHALRYYVASLTEFGFYLFALAGVMIIIPVAFTAGLDAAGISANSVSDIIAKINSGDIILVPWRKPLWFMGFFVMAISVLVSIAETTSRRISGLIATGAG